MTTILDTAREVIALDEKATEGPWTEDVVCDVLLAGTWGDITSKMHDEIEANAAFIAHARTSAPELAKAVVEMEATRAYDTRFMLGVLASFSDIAANLCNKPDNKALIHDFGESARALLAEVERLRGALNVLSQSAREAGADLIADSIDEVLGYDEVLSSGSKAAQLRKILDDHDVAASPGGVALLGVLDDHEELARAVVEMLPFVEQVAGRECGGNDGARCPSSPASNIKGPDDWCSSCRARALLARLGGEG